ncbi:reverse transcriptase domain-containing protein, partial [Tanacetum coccineum]
MKSKHSRDDYLYCFEHTAKLVQEQWVDIINHDGEWTKEEGDDPNKVFVVSFYPRTEPVEPLEWKAPENRLKPSSVEPSKLELKELSKHLEYNFHQENNQLLVVISSALSSVEKTRILDVLRNHKGAIAWSISDIKGIDSSFCTHKILMEDEFKPSVQPQRRVNPNIKEVVKKEVIKLLDAGLIYPISNSPWAIFYELIEDGMDVFMDDFSVFGSSFNHCLKNLEKMLKRCEETNLVLKWEKCHFMVKEGIILGHKVSSSGIEVDKAKIELLVKDAPFNFSEECTRALDTLKRELTQAPIMIKPDWSLPFEIMYDASDYAVGAILGQIIDNHFKPIHYASKTINKAQENYTTIEKEILAVMFAFDKFRQYLVLSKTIEFDIEIRDKRGAKNLAADHLSRLENPDLGKLTRAEIRDLFLEERLMAVSDKGNEP